MISSVIFIVAACAVAVRCWPLVVVLAGAPHCESRHGTGMLALACRTTLSSTALVFGALSRRHVHHHVSGCALLTSLRRMQSRRITEEMRQMNSAAILDMFYIV
jgi:hypothetical protein